MIVLLNFFHPLGCARDFQQRFDDLLFLRVDNANEILEVRYVLHAVERKFDLDDQSARRAHFVSGIYGETTLDDFLNLADKSCADPEEQRTFMERVSDAVDGFGHSAGK